MNSVAYAIETFYNESADFAQLVGKKFVESSSGLFTTCGEDSAFVAINLTGKPMEQFNSIGGTPTRFGFVIPDGFDIERLRQEPAGRQEHSLYAGNYAELSDQIIIALNWAHWRIRSIEGCQILGGPCGDPNPDPYGADIALETCLKWARDDTSVDFDEELSRLLDEDPPPTR